VQASNLYAGQNVAVDRRDFHKDVVQGLSQSPKRLSCKYFYDERGSQLFEQICELEEYYLTRTELAIIETYADAMAYQLGEEVMLVEFGSGSSVKTRILLDRLKNPAAYVPLDISADHLRTSTRELRAEYPNLEILPVVADFTQPFHLPKSRRRPSHAAVFFPGSTIGNFEPEAASKVLCQIAQIVGKQGGLLIGIDLQKDPERIDAAYNDAEGITAMFNLNILNHINNMLGADFDPLQFEHRSRYVPDAGRVETFVVSRCEQTVSLGKHRFGFVQDELIHTEYSYKYTVDGFAEFAAQVGLMMHQYWTDPEQLFAVMHFVNERG
jgi:dimethylhistidine N-methyltransferase